jgi:thiol-disulfide isomerase/thioredoxin
MRISRMIGILLLAFSPYMAQSQEIPVLQIKQWLQAPKGFDAKWESLRGNIVVIEFWATWCSPCISAIPHLNQLAKEFRNQNVVFLAITDDDPERLTPIAKAGRRLEFLPFRTLSWLEQTAG